MKFIIASEGGNNFPIFTQFTPIPNQESDCFPVEMMIKAMTTDVCVIFKNKRIALNKQQTNNFTDDKASFKRNGRKTLQNNYNSKLNNELLQ
jgi:hypothetical protein